MVVDGCALPETAVTPFAFAQLIVEALEDDGEALDEEDAAQYGQEQLLVDAERQHGDDAAYGKAACVAHKDFSWIAVVPEEAYQGAYEGHRKDY